MPILICYFLFDYSPFSRLIWKEVSPAMKPPSCSTACKKEKGIRNNNAEGSLPCHPTVMTIISFSFFEELKSNVTSFVIVISVTKPRENRGNQSSLPYHRATLSLLATNASSHAAAAIKNRRPPSFHIAV